MNVKICHTFSKLLSLGGGKQNRSSWPLSWCSFSNSLPPTEHLQRANIFLNVEQYEFFGYFDKLVTNTFSQSLGSLFILFVVSFTVQKLFCLMQFHCLFLLLFTYPESSVQSLSCIISLRSHGQQHSRPPCPSPTPELVQTHGH